MARHLARVRERRVQRVLDGVGDLGLDPLARRRAIARVVAEPRGRAARSGRARSSTAPPPPSCGSTRGRRRRRGGRGSGRSSQSRKTGPRRARARSTASRASPRRPRARPARRPPRPGSRTPRRAPRIVACGHLLVVRVLVVEVVLADVDHGQLPERRHVHHLVEQALAERALAEEADRDAVGAAALRREARRRSRCPAEPPTIALAPRLPFCVVGDVHRAALAAAVALLLAEQLREHRPGVGALGDAVAVAAVGGGDRSRPGAAPRRRRRRRPPRRCRGASRPGIFAER